MRADEAERANLTEAIRQGLQARPEVMFAYLHGSFLTGGPYRDVDVAVWLDPTRVRVMDLGLTELDPLARAVRNILREKYGFPKKGKFLGTFASSTTILNAYPQSAHLTQWIAEKGWNESQRIKSAAGEAGTRIHAACDALEDGIELQKSNYSLEEWWKINAFVKWYTEYKPELIAKEFAVFSKKGKYAGRLDRLYKLNGALTLLDLKSSSSIHPHFPLQFASYARAIEEMLPDVKVIQTACLQLGASNKAGFRYVIYPDWKDHYKVFENVRAVWQYDYFDSKKNPKEPPVLVLPEKLSLPKVGIETKK